MSAELIPMLPFVHQAVVTLPPNGDDRGPGGAITLALCGSVEHPPPCPLAPHQTAVQRSPDGIGLRIVFACRPDDETLVRGRIDRALAGQAVTAPDGTRVGWLLVSSGPGTLRPDEQDLGARFATG